MKAEPDQLAAPTQKPWVVRYAIIGTGALLYTLVPYLVLSSVGFTTVLASDPHLYAEHMARFFSGQIPYLDFAFEHLPIAIVPMALVYTFVPTSSISYALAFALLMFALLSATGASVHRTALRLGIANGGYQWTVVTGFLLPVVLFRGDPLSVLLASLSLLLAVKGAEAASALSLVGGIASKGWPVALTVVDWWRGRRGKAILVTLTTVVIVGLLMATPGFRSGRSFVGVHQETLSGSVLVVLRLVRGDSSGLVNAAGAVYVQAGVAALAVNFAIGMGLVIAALTVLRHRFRWRAGIALSASITFGLILASPLLSAQFLLWPTPFLALVSTRHVRWLFIAASIVTIGLLTTWSPSSLPWHLWLVLRNALLLASAVFAVIHGIRLAARSE